jgi:ubiquinone/menaquinone biosynthesis C-methylase UbiE
MLDYPTQPDGTGRPGYDQRRYYDLQPGREWARLERHRTEFAVTMRALAEHLPSPPARVLDCGGGPGRYAIELAHRGYEVTLFDLSSPCLRLAEAKAAEAGVALAGYEQGTATDLGRFPAESFDAVLLLGPLYHLLEEEERRRALAEARRVLTPGGLIFAAFISRYSMLRYAATYVPTWPLEHAARLERLLTCGVLPPAGSDAPEFVAYCAHPAEVGPLCQAAGFELRTVLGVEGLVSMIETGVNAFSGREWDTWVDLNYRAASDPTTHGCVEHLLAIAAKPRWRTVLRQVVSRLDAAGLAYKVVGGASAALNGVPIPVKDLDLETNAEDAYRFQALFADHTIQPVALSESEVYRSHFGRFDFGGVIVEVMGDLYRRDGEGWLPATAITQTVIPGVDPDSGDDRPVCASWLEEETLAYIRRGRLERAAQCLPYCNHDRLLALLRKR